jgi:RNA polymerase sigma-70 factor (ECF subfamily)
MKITLMPRLPLAAITLSLLATPVMAVDLLERYPTPLTAGDTDPSHARPWQFGAEDIFHVSQFMFKIGDGFKVETGSADLGIGHCADGAVWAVLIPRDHGILTSSVASNAEAIAHVWLRFHPAQINRLFPPDAVLSDGNGNLAPQIRAIANAKMTTSWQASGKAMIPGPKDMTVYVDTKEGAHRFFMVDTEAHRAEYVAAFNQQSSDQISATSIPPVVVKTVPEAGSNDVPPGEFEVQVTFSKEMHNRSWSWCTVWDNSNPAAIGNPSYDATQRTCSMKVKLEPNTTYAYWLNTGRFTGFRDKEGRSAVPYLLVFQTKGS